MKKISTLALMAFFTCLSAMAQIDLGNIQFSLGEGKKINPVTGKILVTFPNVTGVDDPASTSFTLEGNFNGDNEFDGMEATFAEGVLLELGDFGLEPSTDYTLTITTVLVNGENLAPEDGYTLHFATRGAERKMSWEFVIDEESSNAIQADADAEGKYWIYVSEGNPIRFYSAPRTNEALMLDDNTELPMTEDLTFRFGEKAFYVGGFTATANYHNAIVFNGNNQYMTIPDCQEGDIITFRAVRATTASDSKRTMIQAMDGAAIAPEGEVSSTGVQDSLQLAGNSNAANYKFEVQVAGDLTFRFSNTILYSIAIEEGIEKKPCTYNVVAAYTPEGGDQVVLKTLVSGAEAIAGSTVKVNYSYWLADEAGNVYTHGAKGNPFEEAFDLKGDTTFVINYTKTAMEGAVYLSEGEDIEGAILCTHANVVIRSSNAKAAYFEEDVKLTTLQPGTYKVKAIVFDGAKTASHVVTLYTGAEDVEENEIYLAATATNWTEAESDLLTITEPTDITLKAGGNGDKGLDVIVIYASNDAPDDPEDPAGVVDVNAAQKVTTHKVVKGGQILIVTEAGTFNAAGVLVK